MADDQVVLLDVLPSSFGMRVRIALAEKWIQYEYKEENLLEKSPLLLQMNPVHKMVPVLIHNGKPICESLNILLYIDEVWPHRKFRPLLPSDPYQRSQVRLWADFIDKKLLEGVLGDKLYYGGEKLGLLDVAFIPFYCWFYSYETCGGFSVEAECPKSVEWVRRCKDVESVSKSLVDPLFVFDYVLQLRKRAGLE
ncbi:hypothetical protein FEM48_Zijuj02G0116700 [Ziziphus jujuba var. spinosa]|uniref:Glutathione S-transferase n=1 Tax=Ziziphus jujuba var. spinosa TaxID=714518 RepID=A0A978VVI7_ZIZJJ|nr:hypothetical protein FEM48_Zijuj02G0116700 [Ziziphus jujuba var. spinosa]